MCVVSMVYDHFKPLFPPPPPGYDYPVWPPPYSPAQTQKNINDFRKAIEAARVVDKLTGKPDCADPEKAKLEERIVALEAIVTRLLEKNSSV